MIENGAEPLASPRVLLIGDPSARPTGLERALTRAGFHLVESEDASAAPAADAVLITMKDIEQPRLSELLSCPAGPGPAAPRVVITASTDRDGPAQALAIGAADALAFPVHLPDLCARLHTRIRERQDKEAADAPTPESALEALDRRMKQEFERARRYSLSFSLVLLGIEELRGVEERGGPEAADRLRRDVASALRRELRLPDYVVTYGASEFAIVLPETGQAGARQSVLRVRGRLSVVPSEGDPRLDRPRFSAGIVTYPHHAVSQTDELLALAKAALMRGKAQAGERIGMAI
ncbi:MAG TPA: diguanylate cyclase [Gemmatimonadales bacterium]|nr:diguanylate cyclase [Gemmatimonadales bacterium]